MRFEKQRSGTGCQGYCQTSCSSQVLINGTRSFCGNVQTHPSLSANVSKISTVNCQTWQALNILYPESSVTMLWACLLCFSILRVTQVCTFWEDKRKGAGWEGGSVEDDNEHRATLGRSPWAPRTGWFPKAWRGLGAVGAAGYLGLWCDCDLARWQRARRELW